MSDSVFIVTREQELLDQVDQWGLLEGAALITFSSLKEAYSQLDTYNPLLLLVDRRSEVGMVLGFLRKIRRTLPMLEIIFLESSRSDNVRQTEQMAGVDTLIDLPVDEKDLKLQLGYRIRMKHFRRRCKIIGKSQKLEQILEMILQLAPTDITVLITGDSGTGKELIAQILHRESRRKGEPFLALNCGALPEGTLESELFGHERGAFTGAQSAHPGHFERANGGTLFLDEIGELPHQMQIRLLRVLETGEFIRMGGVNIMKADVRILAATNRDLEVAVREGRFRRDLLHRIKVVEVPVPALRERPEDIPLLVDHFIAELHERENTPLFAVDPDLMEVLRSAMWLGNIRELRNTVQRMGILAKGDRLTLTDLPAGFVQPQDTSSDNLPIPLNMEPKEAERELLYRSILSLRQDMDEVLDILRGFQSRLGGGEELESEMTPAGQPVGRDLSRENPQGDLSEMEKRMIWRALEENHGHRRRAAQQLGISERTLYRKLKEYGLG
ncbi:MAG: sigma-54-dependent Fis family transcriptional regulator [bacterium]|nr:sigma-54-dependent Fis family transcriptional regulator [bacterium]